MATIFKIAHRTIGLNHQPHHFIKQLILLFAGVGGWELRKLSQVHLNFDIHSAPKYVAKCLEDYTSLEKKIPIEEILCQVQNWKELQKMQKTGASVRSHLFWQRRRAFCCDSNCQKITLPKDKNCVHKLAGMDSLGWNSRWPFWDPKCFKI